MRAYAIRLLTLAVSAAVVLPLMTTTGADASSRHLRKHQRVSHHLRTGGFQESWVRREFRPAAPSWNTGGSVCPGNARSFDCKIWPPPFDDDPDRKASGSDAGG